MSDLIFSGMKILVVEDEMLVMMAIEDMLTDLGCTAITVVGSIDQALELVAAQDFDLALLDVNVNGERSYAVAQALEQRGVPFAFSTGYGAHGVSEGFGDHPVLAKPYTEHQLVAGLTNLMTPGVPPPRLVV